VKYAYVDNIKQLPFKGGLGACSCCGSETVAKCGNFKVHHWAHKSRNHCDPWWENEGEWHRKWKNYFPKESQEITFKNSETNERHIADIFINQTIIEVQSYSIKEDEARIRESFYNNMIWVIDGCKNESDKFYFNISLRGAHTEDNYLRKLRWMGRSKILAKWSYSTKPVFIDFGTGLIWNLLSFDPKTKEGLVQAIPKVDFVSRLGGKYT